jgi:A/G-specific adenine glycosylase
MSTLSPKAAFTPALMHWHQHHNERQLPWKGIQNPYFIWLSEIILQQTRAEQGRPYYERFIAAYPTVEELAAAPDDDVFKLWQGLGYYNRCRNLLATARTVAHERGGEFPATYEGLLELKGIGPYTAAAIVSFAFGQPHAVADGNVYRVLARYFGQYMPPGEPAGKTLFSVLANELLDKSSPAAWNQSIMDLGATICLPANPVCDACPLQQHCFAYQNSVTQELPARTAKAPLRQRHLHYVVLEQAGSIWLQRREEGIWRGLYQPLLVEADERLNRQQLAETAELKELDIQLGQLEYEGQLQRKLTHQALDLQFFRVKVRAELALPAGGAWFSEAELKAVPLPKPIALFLEKKGLF